ncbi:hypothetical protein Q428_05480 [Fervidicella metallireducens AeB]|uniref:Uncharacterized protein n=1 Tax=Fervidicella metallireducens AeB TaxID=1403537 RepID=A0A017RWA4_9CLOT|nr:hypothetical protein [Fervidicella metallireducens]EYE88891.1 hypothetical protein Q428_05480 [Fervidicella metallireducens AeB]
MNEIDLFINLLDNDGANFLLQKFKDNVKSDNLSLKRIKLKKIFKNVSNKAKGKRTNTNPFHFAISCFKNEAYEKFSRNELLETLRSDLQGVIPNYVKFANVLYFYNDIVVENMEKIIENYNNNVNLFKDIGEFKTIDEVEKFLLNDKMCKLHIKDVAIKKIKDDMDTSQKIKYDIIEPIIKDWDLVTFQNKLYEESQKIQLI